MSTEEDLRQRLKQVEQAYANERREREREQREKEHERRERERERREKEHERRERERERREKEQAQGFLRNTTLHEYLAASQEYVLSKVRLSTDGYLTTTAPTTNPARKHCPTLLTPWDDFISIQTDTIQLIDRIFPRDRQLFESLSFLQAMGDRMDGVIRGETSLVHAQHNTIEVPVRIILSKINAFQLDKHNLIIPEEINFQTSANNLRDSEDKRDTVKRDAKLRTDQICVFRNSTQRDIAYVIEYKAPHKLHTSHLEQGLRRMDIFDEVVNRITIPTADKFKHYAEILSAAAITQTYHYMLEAGLEYGYLTNGDAIVFLKINWADPAILYYHLAQPLREVIVNEDAAYSNSLCQVLAFTVLALQSSQHNNDERLAATDKCRKWEVDFGCTLDKIIKEEEREAAADPTRGKKRYRTPSSPGWVPRTIKRIRRDPRQQPPREVSDRVLRSHRRDGPGGAGSGEGGSSGGTSGGDSGDSGGSGGGSGETAGGSQGSATIGSSSRPAPGGVGDGQEKPREYCTSTCLLSLVGGRLLDNECPNAVLHRDTTQAEPRHAVSHSQFMDLLRQQLSQSLDKGVRVLGKEGGCGALFQITLLRYGYTFIAKGVTGGRVPELEKEVAAYQKLQPLQGHGIPVCLGSVDLKPLGQVYFYDLDVRIIRFIFLSYGGIEVEARGDESRARIISTVTSILDQMHSLGVAHGDVRWPNVLQGPDGKINIVDFDRAVILPAKSRDTPSAISHNKRRRLVGSDGEEEAASPTRRKRLLQQAIRHAIQQDNSNAQHLFSLDCGRIIQQDGL
ncbi:hypothetical protein GMORB2_1902 [Geosmithia morbida]|uniref:Protein kinase domain-containing protein n=1 Tax=Geosmithia morbida TaxID=1094350 RepID=A0A9P4YSZ5_9HYPO|nr:uncharacterized protein GMORB2_1902 [Geosmithia morbida]KAF4121495.1 hypothetical protein GMORB2_1902 [Geosmithia morbida]